jgi:Xaa-Pro aminopeptidase
MQLLEYLPRPELEKRWDRVRRFMQCDALIVLQNVDQYYLTGTVQTGVLWFPREGEPILAVRKSYERAKLESAVRNIVPLKSYSELPSLFPNPGQTLGLEMDVVPVATYQQIVKQFPNARIVDGSPAFRQARAVKTKYEIDCIREAARQLDRAFLDIPGQLHEGLAEFELAARIEYVLRSAGHQGLTRVRRFNMEMYYGAVSFGDSAAYPHAFDGPVGVRGVYPAAPCMGGKKQLKRSAPVSLGHLSQELRDAYKFALELNSWIEEQLRPGKIPQEIYSGILERVARTPYGSNFMGAGENQVKFVAHGVGLELDELPVIAPKYDIPLEVDVVMAVEPKVFFPGIGGVGVENTYRITESGVERLTECPQEVYTC